MNTHYPLDIIGGKTWHQVYKNRLLIRVKLFIFKKPNEIFHYVKHSLDALKKLKF
jgi:hypothetical protein